MFISLYINFALQRAEQLHAKNKERLIRLHERSNQSLLKEIRPQQAKIQELRLELERIQGQADSKKHRRKQQEDEIAAAKVRGRERSISQNLRLINVSRQPLRRLQKLLNRQSSGCQH